MPDLDDGIAFYSRLGHTVLWRNEAVSQAGLALPDCDTEPVLTVEQNYEPNWLVESVEVAVREFMPASSAEQVR